MQRNLTALLFGAAATLLGVHAHADDASDAPIETAPPEYRAEALVAQMNETAPEPITIDTGWLGGGPWLTAEREPGCERELTLGISQGHIEPELGLDVADREPTSSAGLAATCGNWRARIGASAVVSPEPNRGTRRLANKVQVQVGYDLPWRTRVGTFTLQGDLLYSADDVSQGIEAMRDDKTRVIAGLEYSARVGRYRFLACVRGIKENPIGYINSLYWASQCAEVTGPFLRGSTFRIAHTRYQNVNSVMAVPHRNVAMSTIETMRERGPHRFMTGVSYLQYGERDCRLDPHLDRDGRVMLYYGSSARSCTQKDNWRVHGGYAYRF